MSTVMGTSSPRREQEIGMWRNLVQGLDRDRELDTASLEEAHSEWLDQFGDDKELVVRFLGTMSEMVVQAGLTLDKDHLEIISGRMQAFVELLHDKTQVSGGGAALPIDKRWSQDLMVVNTWKQMWWQIIPMASDEIPDAPPNVQF